MSVTQSPVIIGICEDEAELNSIIDKLQDAGFNEDQIWILMHKGRLTASDIRGELMNIGVSEEEADIYEREFETGHSLVLVVHNGRRWDAAHILYGNKIHRYLKRLKYQQQASRNSSSSNLATSTQLRKDEETISDTSWQKILFDAGLDKLFDDFS